MIKNKTKTTEQKRNEISKYMGYISNSQIDLLYEIATLNRYSNKNEKMIDVKLIRHILMTITIGYMTYSRTSHKVI